MSEIMDSYQTSTYERVVKKFVDLGKLSGPIVFSRVGFLLFSFVDVIMVGSYLTNSLAAISITHAIADTFMLIGVGMIFGVLVKSSMAVGEAKPEDAGDAMKRGVIYSFALGLFASIGCISILPFLSMMGFEPSLAAEITRLMFIISIGLPAILIHINYSFFLEGLSRPTPATLVIIVGNLLNVFLNYALVFGEFGFPEMGAEGSAWSTTVVRVFLAIALIVYVHMLMRDGNAYGVNKKTPWSWKSWQDQRNIGYGSGLSFGLEAGAFMILALIAGLISPVVAAATAILINIRSLLFMIPMGIGFATSVHVGMGKGENDFKDINLSTWTGLTAGVVLTLMLSLFVLIFETEILDLYSNDPELIKLCIPVMLFLAVAMPLDAWQGIMCSALRGREDVVFPTLYHGIAFICVMVPAAWWFGMIEQGGVTGIFIAVIIGNITATLLFTHRHIQLNGSQIKV
ncbi:MAG: MATE family efflux transporter [Gammaproteobacteria bacterium]|nr:MATE family efflux transporter [Gammaproteobacteria bacterium]